MAHVLSEDMGIRDELMRYLLALLLLGGLNVRQPVQAQDCRCIGMTATINSDKSRIKVKVTNRCNTRIWFHTRSFYINAGLDGTSDIYKLRTDEADFVLMKWMETRTFDFKTEVTNPKKKVSLSYANTSYFKPRNLFGPRTYVCETPVKFD